MTREETRQTMPNQPEIESRIEDAFTKLLTNTRFEKVTVTAITKEAGISNQTFYRYYADKFDLALQISYKLLSAFAIIYGNNSTWKEVAISVLYSIKNHPVIFKRLIEDPNGLDIVLKSLFMISKNFTGEPGSEYTYSIWGTCLKIWRKNHFWKPVEEVYVDLIRNQPAIDVLRNSDEKKKYLSDYENTRMQHFQHPIKR